MLTDCNSECFSNPFCIPVSGEVEPEASAGAWAWEPASSVAASEARLSMAPPSSERRVARVPNEDQRRGEAAAEAAMLEGVLEPLSVSLQMGKPCESVLGNCSWETPDFTVS